MGFQSPSTIFSSFADRQVSLVLQVGIAREPPASRAVRSPLDLGVPPRRRLGPPRLAGSANDSKWAVRAGCALRWCATGRPTPTAWSLIRSGMAARPSAVDEPGRFTEARGPVEDWVITGPRIERMEWMDRSQLQTQEVAVARFRDRELSSRVDHPWFRGPGRTLRKPIPGRGRRSIENEKPQNRARDGRCGFCR